MHPDVLVCCSVLVHQFSNTCMADFLFDVYHAKTWLAQNSFFLFGFLGIFEVGMEGSLPLKPVFKIVAI